MHRLFSPLLALIATVHAAPFPELVKLLSEQPGVHHSDPSGFTVLGESLLFTATDGSHGRELWVSDGTEAGTRLLKDLRLSQSSSDPRDLTVFGHRVFFRADDGFQGSELWSSDGTAEGTVLVADLRPGPEGSSPGGFVVFGDQLFFHANDGVHGRELWRTDGSAEGTMLVADIAPGIESGSPRSLTSAAGQLWFSARHPDVGEELWRYDGSELTLQADVEAGEADSWPSDLVEVGEWLCFRAFSEEHGYELRRARPDQLGSSLLADLVEGAGHLSIDGIQGLGDHAYFATSVGLVRSDATPGGTVRLTQSSMITSGAGQLYAIGNRLFFPQGKDLWTSDGTVEGTRMLLELPHTPAGGRLTEFTGFRDGFCFFADLGSGDELWVSDGSAEGTSRIASLSHPGEPPASPFSLSAFGDHLFFRAIGEASGAELWRSDGTAEGTALFREIATGTEELIVRELTAAGSRVFFVTAENESDRQGEVLWTSDGTADGTGPVLPEEVALTEYQDYEALGNRFFFVAAPANGPRELWTVPPAGEARRIAPAPGIHGASDPLGLAAVGDLLYFSGYDTEHGRELWSTDGTPEGTRRVLDLSPGAEDANPTFLTAFQGQLYFFATTDGWTGTPQFWKSDGTPAGTSMVMSEPGLRLDPQPEPVVSGERIFFTARTSAEGSSLWASDGLPSGTAPVFPFQSIVSLNGGLLPSPERLVAASETRWYGVGEVSSGQTLWTSDGTGGAQALLSDVRFRSTSEPFQLAVAGDLTFFGATVGTAGYELWVTNGTPAGTRMVKDLYVRGSNPDLGHLSPVGPDLYFKAIELRQPSHLWRSDGTESGTELVTDEVGTDFEAPSEVVVAGDRAFFAANTHNAGTGLFAFELEGAPAVTPARPFAVTDRSIVLSGFLHSGGSPVTAEVEFGLSEAYGSRLAIALDRAESAAAIPFTVPLENLQAGAVYHYRIVATNDSGTTIGQASTFSLANQPPDFDGLTIQALQDTEASVSLAEIRHLVRDREGHGFEITLLGGHSLRGGPVRLVDGSIHYQPVPGTLGQDRIALTFADEWGASAVGFVNVAIEPAPGVDLTGSQIPVVVTRTAAGPVEVCFHGVPGRQYRIQRSEELAAWTDLETVTASPDGKLFLLDLAPPEGRAFYRVALPAP